MLYLLMFLIAAMARLSAESTSPLFDQPITVDLREPTYAEGVLCTTQGGIIQAEGIRIQARKLVYTCKNEEEGLLMNVEAESDLMVEYGDWVFVGERLEYDFVAKQGVLFSGRSSYGPWFFGGEEIYLQEDGSCLINNGFVTTSENYESDWQIESPFIHISAMHLLYANSVRFRFIELPIFLFPSYTVDLDKFSWRAPLKYRARWSSKLGPYIGATYCLYQGSEWTASLLFDYSLRRGAGGGIEIEYEQEGGPRQFFNRAYYVNERSAYDPRITHRYRFSGRFIDCYEEDNLNIFLTYDKVSDKYMPSDYYQDGIESRDIESTQLVILKQEENWIAEGIACARLNTFQTVKEELPCLSASWRPFPITRLEILSDSRVKAGYLDFLYEDNLTDVHDYRSWRLEWRQLFYRPFFAGHLLLTPEAGWTSIYYSQSPIDTDPLQVVGYLGLNARTRLVSYYGACKHVVEPYLYLQSYNASVPSLTDTYIFDVDDGWSNIHLMRIGLLNDIYCKEACQLSHPLEIDLYTYAFFNTSFIPSTFPRVYADVDWMATPTLKCTLSSSWNCAQGQLDTFSLRAAMTFNADAAVRAEYRHRGPFAWRKLDYENFFFESVHDQATLLASPLSDRRDTLLLHLFWRIHPRMAWELETQMGWNRKHEPHFNEYQIDCHYRLGGGIATRLSYQYQENDHRFALYFSLEERAAIPYSGCNP